MVINMVNFGESAMNSFVLAMYLYQELLSVLATTASACMLFTIQIDFVMFVYVATGECCSWRNGSYLSTKCTK